MSELEDELGGALGPQGGGECSGLLDMAREGLVAVNWREKLVGVLWLRTEETRGVAHSGAQRGEGSEPGASTSPGDASRQAGCVLARAHAALRARWPRWTGAP